MSSVTISEELESKFMDRVYALFRYKRGNKKMCVEEAIEDWIVKADKQIEVNKKSYKGKE